MRSSQFDLRGVVMMWTIMTSTFVWTPTMRLLLKPEISHWSIFGVGGVGGHGPFWLLPLIALGALLLFYVEGRGRLRSLFHVLLLAWHLPITAGLIYGSLSQGSDAVFTGAAWGVKVPFPLLAVPFIIFSVLAVLLVVREARSVRPEPILAWRSIHGGKLVIAVFLLPVAAGFFHAGDGFDALVKIAIVATVLQWIFLAEALGPKQTVRSREVGAAPSPMNV